MKIYLVRHAKRGHGEEQDTLTGEGFVQARELKERLKNLRFGKIYCSNSNRCRDTIKPFLEDSNIEIEYTQELEEKRLGILQGKTGQEFRDALERSGLEKDKFRPEGGENLEDFETRVKKFISFLKENETKDVLIITHVGVIRLFKKLIEKREGEIPRADFTSVYCLEL